jgi:protein TonB
MNMRTVDATPDHAEDVPGRTSGALIWILALVVLLGLVWFFVNRNQVADTTGDVTAPAVTGEAEVAPAPGAPAAAQPNRGPAAVRSARQPVDRGIALIERPAVAYPPEAYRAREEGRVLVNVDVDPAGNVTGASIVERSGSQTLDRAALEEVRTWKFSPALEDGKPVAASIEVPVAYTLGEG